MTIGGFLGERQRAVILNCMVAKVLSLDAARAKRGCRRADGTRPERAGAARPMRADGWRPRPDTRLAKALAAVATLEHATFEEKVAAFKRAWEKGAPREVDGIPRR